MAKQERTRARGVLLIAMLLLVSVIGGLLVAGAAGAQTAGQPGDPYTPTRTPKTSIHPIRTSTPPPPPPIVLRKCVGCEGPLPFTGADLTLFIVTGFAAIATGAVLVRRTRARRASPEV